MRKKVMFLAVLVFFILGLAQVAAADLAWHHNGPPKNIDSEKWTSIADTLKLTDDQMAKIQGLQKAHYEKNKGLRAELQENMFALKQLRWQKDADQKVVGEKINKVNDLRSQLYNEHQKFHAELEAILTPEQREQLKS
ncbi:MAG TPA: Spy/CpxP family protein refolding chaperone, partial [Clostridia bacterium]|nr:Spy/CpxP family protein refolding chaperone [Clostridia bacterium]